MVSIVAHSFTNSPTYKHQITEKPYDSVNCAVSSFWTALSFLLLFAYPTPENPTPSYEYHTAFTGVALGIVSIQEILYSAVL